MPDDVAASVVSGAPETSAESVESSSSASTQAADESTTTPRESSPESAKEPERTDWKARAKEDADLKAFVQAEANLLAQKMRDRERKRALRAQASKAIETGDADTALEVAGHVASEPDDDPPPWSQEAQEQSRQQLHQDKAFVNSVDYRNVWAYSFDELQEQYAKLPAGEFRQWVAAEADKLEKKRKAEIRELANALKTEEVQQTLKDMGVPLNGASGGPGLVTLDRYNADPALRAKLRSTPEGRKQIDDMMARASRAG